MEYQLRNSKIDTGRYEFSYGRGDKKLTAEVWQNDVAGGWQLDEDANPDGISVNKAAPFGKLKDLKAAWEAWARAKWKHICGEGPDPDAEPAEEPKRKGPPSLKRKGPPKRKKGPPSLKDKTVPPRRHRPEDGPHVPEIDPFDEKFRYPADHPEPAKQKQDTPLAVLYRFVQTIRDGDPEDPAATLEKAERVAANCIERECPSE